MWDAGLHQCGRHEDRLLVRNVVGGVAVEEQGRREVRPDLPEGAIRNESITIANGIVPRNFIAPDTLLTAIKVEETSIFALPVFDAILWRPTGEGRCADDGTSVRFAHQWPAAVE